MIRRRRAQRVELPAGIPVEVWADEVEFPGGHAGHHIRITTASGRPGVVVLPVRDGRIGLVRSHRYVLDLHMWEAPRGFGEGTDPDADARRELMEETGHEAVALHPLGAMHPNSGLLDESVHLFLAEIDASAAPGPTDGEVEELAWFAPREVYRMADEGTITDGFTLSVLLRARDRFGA